MQTFFKPSRCAELESLSWKFVEGVGEEEEKNFVPSAFQIQAIEELKKRDVLVVAPTGSGKTYIAEQIFSLYLAQQKTCWYTTPLKALSNQKFDAFRQIFGKEKVGLITGERKIHQHAPIIVATTEVLRNLLYTPAPKPDLAVLDEVHFLSDPERGVTWEEILILAPPSLRLALLSATVSNPEELVAWMQSSGRKKIAVILEKERPVPLRFGLLLEESWVLPLKKKFLMLTKRERPLLHSFRLLLTLEKFNLLPAIVFMNRRSECDGQVKRFQNYELEGKEKRLSFLSHFLKEYPYVKRHPFFPILIQAGVAPHHAGHMTAWKICVEKMLRQNLLKAVFATTTLAAGLDVPARSVVLPTLKVRDQTGRRFLSATEFHQMTGRAGRRGKDKVGFVLFVASTKEELSQAQRLIYSFPEPLTSSFRVTYYQILNLLYQRSLEEALDFLRKSFAVFQKEHGAGSTPRQAQLLRKHFLRRVFFLQEKGYLYSNYSLTELGKIAKEIHQEKCLYITESMKEGLWENLSDEEVAGAAALFTTERAPRECLGHFPIRPFWRSIRRLEKEQEKRNIDEPFSEKKKYGFRDAERKASCVTAFGEGLSFDELVSYTRSEPGDLQRLILQTCELLQELERIPDPLAHKARRIRPRLLRSPVL